MRIDAHHHLWRIGRGDYDWLTPDLAAIHRDFEPADLKPLLDAQGIDGTILVQAAPTVAETEFMLGLAADHDWIRGVVGWVDMEAADAPATVERLARDPKLVGLRPMIQTIPDDEWMLRPALAPAIDAMLATGLRFDALVLPRHLAHLRAFADRYPDLPIVIDHGAKPHIADGAMEPWAGDMRALAAGTGALCKLSGLVTEAGERWSEADLTPYARLILDAFGPERTMWGSDWPVLDLASDYATWADIAHRLVGPYGEDALARVFGGTAGRFYLDHA